MKDTYSMTKKACYISYTVQAIAVNIAPLFFVILRKRYGLSFTELGSLVLFIFLTQLCIDIASIKIIDRLGFRYTAIIANATATLGLILMGVLPQIIPILPALLISSFLYSVGAGLIEVVINPIVEALPNENIGSTLTLLHSFYGWGQACVILISTIILYLVTDEFWYLIPILWAFIPFMNVLIFFRVPIIEAKSDNQKHSSDILKTPVFVLFLIIMLCGGSTEMVIAQWASYFAEAGLGVNKVAGDLLGPCIFGLMMAVGRTLYSIFGKRVHIFKALTICSFVAFLSYVGITFISNPIIVMLCFALAGISSSLLWPGTLAASSLTIKNGGTAMFALLAFAGDAGCSLGPWINGVVNDLVLSNACLQCLNAIGFSPEESALRESILATALFPLLMLIVLFIVPKVNKNK